ncbi:MAG: hypothetical protein WBI99_09120 [Limnochordia bacterium]|nr:hypothetical protein [Limnochordia bacterium]MDI9464348.1 hypothetical protein [Bacillota bacterium]HAN95122.1 hypothetical protein [Bacillota bacterium]HOB39810.1 hypothetical protein [Limnochordia bacterium]HOQ73831.1 hypothetical protein [Limnochordia bacterium]
MDFLARLFAPGRSRSKAKTGYVKRDGRYAIWIYVQCDRCGEKIPVRLRTTSELQKREGPDAELGPGQYFVRKTVVGSRCYQRIEATVDFDAKYDVVDSEVINGKLITYGEYKKDEQ